MYHISDIKKYLRCGRLYLYSREEDSTYNAYLRSDETQNDLLVRYFRMEDPFIGIRNDTPDRFEKERELHEWFLRPRFESGSLRFNVPVLHRIGDRYDVYFVYYNTSVKDLDLLTYRITIRSLKRLGYDIQAVYLLSFNKDYVYHDHLDVDQLFVLNDTYKDLPLLDVISKEDFDTEKVLKEMDELKEELPSKKRACRMRSLCQHYYDCFPEEKDLPDDSILFLVSSANKQKMYEKGIVHMKDADISLLEGNPLQYAQIRASKNGGLFADRCLLKSYLDTLSTRPVSFIDFEWDRYLVPAYEGMKPMDVVCFEFALYILKEDNTLHKYTFIGTGDCRKEFTEALLEYLPEEGPILAYNAMGAEVLRLKELSVLYPEYAGRLHQIMERFHDLADPFTEGMVYSTKQRGDLTLKKLVSIVSDLSYHDLDIDNGMKAVYSWRDIDKGDPPNKEEVLSNLEEYCSLDAYGLYLVYRWLYKIVS